MHYDAFIFDQDNTLADTERHWPGLDAAYFPTLIGEVGWQAWKPDWLRMRKDHVSMDEMLCILKERFGIALPVERIKADREATMFRLYQQNRLAALPGAHEILAYAKERGIPVAVASGMNTPIIEFVTNHLGWMSHVKVYASTHEGEKRNKPHPDVYLLAAKRLGVDPSRCLAFENDWKGCQSALAAGMECHVVLDDNEERRAELIKQCAKIGKRTFTSLHEVLEDLKARS